MKRDGVLYWITGLSGAGKTTIGNRLFYELRKTRDNVVLLDGDIMRKIVGDHLGFSEEDRRKRAIKYAMLCKMLTDQGMTVICCTIAMYDEVRDWNRINNKGYIEIFLDVPLEILKLRDQKGMYSRHEKNKMSNLAGVDVQVEFPKSPNLTLCNDGTMSIKECVDKILALPTVLSSDFDRDVDYWNHFYDQKPKIEEPSLFAREVARIMKPSKNVLELGCGNGRDSLYFATQGMNVTAIDASNYAVEMLQEQHRDEGNICFICDDFVCSSTIFVGQYDYCYSRFTLHAINEQQESEVIQNVYNVLKEGGKFFIETRSIHDDIYRKGKKVGKRSYIYNGHFRRFIVKTELEKKLKNVGFQLEYSEEQRNFAPFGDSNPPIIRIIASR